MLTTDPYLQDAKKQTHFEIQFNIGGHEYNLNVSTYNTIDFYKITTLNIKKLRTMLGFVKKEWQW